MSLATTESRIRLRGFRLQPQTTSWEVTVYQYIRFSPFYSKEKICNPFAVSWSATKSGSWLWFDLTLGIRSVSIRNTGNSPPPHHPLLPRFMHQNSTSVCRNSLSTGNREEGRQREKGGREQKQRYRLSHNLYCPISRPPTAGLNLGRIFCLQYCRWQAPRPTLGPYASL